ncbi:hypothetical protein [Actinomadura sp. J1-007]|nr:hypothetical protein [Actinomadura sp. J1-007]
MVSYLEERQGDADWLLAVGSAQEASALILQTGRPVIAMGGFTGSDPAMTVRELQRYAKEGRLHYVLVNGDGDGDGGFGPRRGGSEVTDWVRKNGTAVPATAYGGIATTSGAQLYYLA